jgi:PBP1b-binding outer membrane lipoprotein LpoB
MKKIIIMIVIALLVVVVTGCVPTDPKEIPQYCQTLYETDFSDYPPSFVGACTSMLQSGNTAGMKSLCGYEQFLVDNGFSSHKECVQALAHYSGE